MSCNCNDTSPCSRCNNGQPCNCPPDYSVSPQPNPCGCCPNGFTFQQPSSTYPNGICVSITGATGTTWCCGPGYVYYGPTPNFPNGSCSNDGGKTFIDPTRCPLTTPAIPCVPCEEAVSMDCVTYTGQIPLVCGNNIYGINPGDSLTMVLSKMCITNVNVMEALLSAIGLNPTVYSGFCQLAAGCPAPIGGTTPIPLAIVITFP